LRGSTVLFAVSIALLLYFVAFPILGMIWESLRTPEGYSLDNYIGFFSSGAMLHAAFNTVLVALFTGVGSVLLATPLAFGVARTQMRCKQLLRLAVIISFASPPFLMTLAYIFIAGPNVGYANILIREIFGLTIDRGPLDIFSLPGFIVLALPNTVAFVFIIMLPAFANMDAAMEEASRIVGAGKFRTIWHITLPTMRAAMLAGGLLAFSTALAMFATPQMLGIEVLTVAMRRSIVV
jgi:iron(III) transport system permease protein